MADAGFGVTPACLTDAECDDLIGIVTSGVLSRSRAGARHLLANRAVAALAIDDRMLGLAEGWLNHHAVPFRATLFEKSTNTNWLIPWHQDTALPLTRRVEVDGWGPWSEKAGAIYAHAPASALSRVIALRIHLDASDSENGPLRVIPGSHMSGVLSDSMVAEYVAANEPFECLTPRGGVIAMRPLLIHASSKARSANPRRVLHIEYADSLDLGDGQRLAVL